MIKTDGILQFSDNNSKNVFSSSHETLMYCYIHDIYWLFFINICYYIEKLNQIKSQIFQKVDGRIMRSWRSCLFVIEYSFQHLLFGLLSVISIWHGSVLIHPVNVFVSSIIGALCERLFVFLWFIFGDFVLLKFYYIVIVTVLL